jgi:hypothetical protein
LRNESLGTSVKLPMIVRIDLLEQFSWPKMQFQEFVPGILIQGIIELENAFKTVALRLYLSEQTKNADISTKDVNKETNVKHMVKFLGTWSKY